MNKKILFIISDTGGGHRSAAKAIIESLAASGQNVRCEMVDLLRASGLPGIRSAPELYAFFSAGHIWLHNFLFRLSNNSRFMDFASDFLYHFARGRIRQVVEKFDPDLVVVIHPLAVRPMCTYRDETQARWPVVTVVTDLVNVHASWLSNRADLYLLPTVESRQVADRHGINTEKLRLVGFPIHPRFCAPPMDRTAARTALNLPASQFTILLTSGGAGGGQLASLVDELERHCPHVSILAVTGRNQTLFRKLASRAPLPPNTHVFGFVDNMEQLMAAADLVITKAGPGTIAEAVALQRPLLITGAVGLQEEGNIRFVLAAGIGVYVTGPASIAEAVARLSKSAPSANEPPANRSFAGTSAIAELLLSLPAFKQGEHQ
jgi:UDP-N-acetylglucosamine:LPS N-acetylglucosamine transferase